MSKALVKKQSKIHGTGIFTTREIDEGEIFYKVPLENTLKSPKPRCAFVGNNTWVDDEKVLNYVNHSCESNALLEIGEKPRLVALRNIISKEEITVDYNRTEVNGVRTRCNCGSSKCVGYFLK